MSRTWNYKGATVIVSSTADIPSPYRPRQDLAWVVQRCLEGVKPWSDRDGVIAESEFPDIEFPEIVTSLKPGMNIIWAVHRGHKAFAPEVSPFVNTVRGSTRNFTVELVGTTGRPRLVRAYPGEYIPPLPWQVSAREAEGGVEACRQYWKQHAYLWNPRVILTSSVVNTPPAWWLQRRAA